ncbi:hypothetical protein VSS37_03805 [Candidatus Thiothrix sp. Deng01]|uniref:Uncharacterized protein n=1 Tax=Candidatus Thiothrix phosphatis TaxID=3112415 RepID=A0ABU6CTD2_9GAMM|nr:hypothetical protein [Candidatus Thiothrix sp. Deng01]MEB4590096.1 hypothetical protein [Candidatus Thiothrix sp. Deng01]
MPTLKTVVAPSDFNATHFDTTTNNKVNLSGPLLNPFFTDVTLDTATDPANPVYKFTQYGGTVKAVPAGVNDVHLDTAGTDYDAASMVLTLALNDGGSKTINLMELAKTSTQDSTSIAFSGDGTAGNKLSAMVKTKAAGGITDAGSGLEVVPADINTLTHDVVLKDMAGNVLMYGSSTGAP